MSVAKATLSRPQRRLLLTAARDGFVLIFDGNRERTARSLARKGLLIRDPGGTAFRWHLTPAGHDWLGDSS